MQVYLIMHQHPLSILKAFETYHLVSTVRVIGEAGRCIYRELTQVNKGVRLLPLNQDHPYTVRYYLIWGKCVCGGGGGGWGTS